MSIKTQGKAKFSAKKATSVPEISPEQMRPKFSFEFLTGKFCVSKCQRDDKAALISRLHMLSSKTWVELRDGRRHGFGYEIMYRADMRAKIPRHVTDDVPLLVFRFNGKKVMIGYKEREVYYLLAIDRNFTAYNHGS